jgi:hypothetical protein
MVDEVDLDRGVNTRVAAELLGIRAPALQRAVWDGRLDAPQRFGRSFIWTARELEQAAWVFWRKPLDQLLADRRGQ